MPGQPDQTVPQFNIISIIRFFCSSGKAVETGQTISHPHRLLTTIMPAVIKSPRFCASRLDFSNEKQVRWYKNASKVGPTEDIIRDGQWKFFKVNTLEILSGYGVVLKPSLPFNFIWNMQILKTGLHHHHLLLLCLLLLLPLDCSWGLALRSCDKTRSTRLDFQATCNLYQ